MKLAMFLLGLLLALAATGSSQAQEIPTIPQDDAVWVLS